MLSDISVAKEFIEGHPIPLPPLSEQQRIGRILDEAFDGIATAKANAATDPRSARALFESQPQAVFTRRGEGWKKRRLGEVAESILTGSFGNMQTGMEKEAPKSRRSERISGED